MNWTYCKDEMPPNYADVIFSVAIVPRSYVFRGFYSGREWRSNDGSGYIFEREDKIYAWAYWPDPAPLPEETDECTT